VGQDFEDLNCYECGICHNWSSDGRVLWGSWTCTECIAIEYGYYDDFPYNKPKIIKKQPHTRYKVDIKEIESNL
jgi:hypothetical protein